METEGEKKVYEVKIAGMRVRLKSSHSEERVRQLTDFVSQQIKKTQEANPSASFQNALFLTCLHLSEELVLTKSELRLQLKDIKNQTVQLLSEIESSPLNQATLDV